jgi:DNA adenine methylase
VDDLVLGFSTLVLNRTNQSGIIKDGVIGGKEQKGNYKIVSLIKMTLSKKLS